MWTGDFATANAPSNGLGNTGGGFMPNNSQMESPAGGDKKGPRKANNTMPVSIKQLINFQGEKFEIEGIEAGVVTIVGIVRSVEFTTSKITYMIDDHTGIMPCFEYIEQNQNSEFDETYEMDDGQGRVLLKEGTHARIYGALRNDKMKAKKDKESMPSKYLVIYRTAQITDLNELTCHLLEVTLTPLKLKKHKENEAGQIGGLFGNSGNLQNSLTNSMVGGTFTSPVKAVGADAKIKNIDKNVVNILKTTQGSNGLHKDQIVQSLKGNYSKEEILKSIEFLSAEGHIFSTVDDDHYKVTDW